MGWVVFLWCLLMIAMGFRAGSPTGVALHLFTMAATFPPLWSWLKHSRELDTRPGARWVIALTVGFIAFAVNGHAYSLTPAGKAAAAARQQAKADKEASELAAEEEKAAGQRAVEEAAKRDGDHCFSGWDGAVLGLKDAVKSRLRNPDSFDHSRTIHTKPNPDGKIGAMMEYRAQNGFGGMNVEAIAVSIDPETCDFVEIGARELERDFLQ